MENRITISICDEEYTFVAEEAPSYMQKVGSYVNDKMSELLDAAKVGRTDAAVLTAVNITDELFKEREAGDALRRQLKQYLDEASQAKNEVSELKRDPPAKMTTNAAITIEVMRKKGLIGIFTEENRRIRKMTVSTAAADRP